MNRTFKLVDFTTNDGTAVIDVYETTFGCMTLINSFGNKEKARDYIFETFGTRRVIIT